ncbi:MAG TPA: hypothetical protein VGH74_21075, partial [Planctomycetaceae bacterium]
RAFPNASYPATAYPAYNGYQGMIFSNGVPGSPIIPYQMAFSGNPLLVSNPNAQAPPLYTSGAISGPYNGSLSANPVNGGVVDEPDEMVSLGAYVQSNDQFLTIDDTAALQLLSATDYNTAVGQSRVRQLASWNFELNVRAAQIRQRFTTASSDRRNHGFAAALNTTGTTGNRAWEYGVGSITPNWDGTGTNQFPPMVIQTTASSNLGNSMDNQVPANYDTPNANNQLNGVTASGTPVTGATAAEPFRLELAALIGAKLNNAPWNGISYNGGFKTAPFQFRTASLGVTPWHQQLRYNINRFLTVADPAFNFGISGQQNQQNPLKFRELTPHPTALEWAALSSTAAATAVGGSPTGSFLSDAANFSGNPALQEYWARRDRQQMARDLYVMLYMFGGGQDTTVGGNTAQNYATTSNKGPAYTLYQPWQLAQMAQFAVNVVDSLDRDDTITAFEYDIDLSDGWNLDDNPFTIDTSADRLVVYGVEAQQLAFNEALVIASMRVPLTMTTNYKDHPATLFDDSIQDRTFSYLELYNVSPNTVPVNNQNWQIMLLNMGVPAVANPQPSTDAYSVLTFNDYNNVSIPAGQPYTIGSRTYSTTASSPSDALGTGAPRPSQFVVDTTYTGAASDVNVQTTPSNYYIVPAAGGTLNLDLVGSALSSGSGMTPSDSNQPFILTMNGSTSATTTIGAFCDLALGGVAIPVANTPITTTFVLRRRLDLNRPAPKILSDGNYAADDLDNPYIEVDRISYKNNIAPGQTLGTSGSGGYCFNLKDPNDSTIVGGPAADAAVDIIPKLQLLASRERKQPLDGCEGSAGTLGSPT